uniref:PWWP domain-containing protein n=1 Tax=Parascaris equorum TaxID=6256 RepID=A0A914S316_PAREQ
MHRVRLSHAAGIDPESGIVPTLRSDEPVQVDVGAIIVSEVLAEGRPWWPDLHVLDVAEYISILDTPLNRHPYQYPYQRDLPLQVGCFRFFITASYLKGSGLNDVVM